MKKLLKLKKKLKNALKIIFIENFLILKKKLYYKIISIEKLFTLKKTFIEKLFSMKKITRIEKLLSLKNKLLALKNCFH